MIKSEENDSLDNSNKIAEVSIVSHNNKSETLFKVVASDRDLFDKNNNNLESHISNNNHSIPSVIVSKVHSEDCMESGFNSKEFTGTSTKETSSCCSGKFKDKSCSCPKPNVNSDATFKNVDYAQAKSEIHNPANTPVNHNIKETSNMPMENSLINDEERGSEKHISEVCESEKSDSEEYGREKDKSEKHSSENDSSEKHVSEECEDEKSGNDECGSEKLGSEEHGIVKHRSEAHGYKKCESEESRNEERGSEVHGSEESRNEECGGEVHGSEESRSELHGGEKRGNEVQGGEVQGGEESRNEEQGSEKIRSEECEIVKRIGEERGNEERGSKKSESKECGSKFEEREGEVCGSEDGRKEVHGGKVHGSEECESEIHRSDERESMVELTTSDIKHIIPLCDEVTINPNVGLLQRKY